MQQVITAKLKLITTPEQAQALRQTQLAYRDALNGVSCYAFAQGKTSNVMLLHRGMYAELRTHHHLPSQLACSVERQVAATYKGLWTKLKKNAEHRRKKITKKRFKGLDKPPTYSSPTVQYTYERDYTFGRNQQVSVGTLDVSASRTRATTSILRSFDMGPVLAMPSSGMIKRETPSISLFLWKLTYLSQHPST